MGFDFKFKFKKKKTKTTCYAPISVGLQAFSPAFVLMQQSVVCICLLNQAFFPFFLLSFFLSFFFFFCILLLLFVVVFLFYIYSTQPDFPFASRTNLQTHTCWIATAWASMQAALKPMRSILVWNRHSVHSTAQTEERRTWNCFNTLSRPIACYVKVQVFDHIFCKKVVLVWDRNPRKSHRQSDQHWNCFNGNARKTVKRRGSANSLPQARRYYFQLNWTERKCACSAILTGNKKRGSLFKAALSCLHRFRF